jgi:hypothetical protein
MATSPSSISLKQLTGTVDKAVKAALQRNPAKTSSGFILNPGILAGPLLDVATDLRVAQKIADDITAQVQKEQSGAHATTAAAPVAQNLQSGVLVTHSHILCGFFPYPNPILKVEE